MEILKQIGLTENEIKLYTTLLKQGTQTAYELSKKTSIYRAHVYDKLEQLMDKGLVTHIYKGAKKHFQATPPEKLLHYMQEKKKLLEEQEEQVQKLIPTLNAFTLFPKEQTKVEVFKGIEGLKYFLKDIVKTAEPVCISGIDDAKYEETIPTFMRQIFRDLKRKNIKERVITIKDKNVFLYDKQTSPTTSYRFLDANQFNPTNTFIYGSKVVIVTWSTPITAIMIQNSQIATTYRNHFNHLWSIASTSI